MTNITDKDLIKSLTQKFEEKDKALFDLTRLNKALEDTNQRLLESERLKTSFLSNLKNELNNPMASILGLCDELKTVDLKDETKTREMANSLFLETLSLEFQLNNILTAAEFESGEFLVDTVKVDVNSIIESTVKNFSSMISEKRIDVIKHLVQPAWINSDPEKLQIIIDNLMSNAVMFNNDGGSIYIDAAILDDTFFISFKDSGIGIPNDKFKVIFDRFVQLDKGSTKRFRGHGLGLSVAKAAANVLSGDITVTSNIGIGSRFTFMAPVNADAKGVNLFVDGVEFFENNGEEKEF